MDEIKDLMENAVQAVAASPPSVEDITDVAGISAEERAAIKRQTPWALPNSPVGRGMSADDVKPFFYEGIVGEKHSLATYHNRLVREVNDNLAKIRALLQAAEDARGVLDDELGNLTELIGSFDEEADGEHQSILTEVAQVKQALQGKRALLPEGVKQAVYTRSSSGKENYASYTSVANPGTIPIRGADNEESPRTFKIGDPILKEHPVTLGYFDKTLGDVEAALDAIIAMQEALIGGTAV